MDTKEKKLSKIYELIKELNVTEQDVIEYLILSSDNIQCFISEKKKDIQNFVEVYPEIFNRGKSIFDCLMIFTEDLEDEYNINIPLDIAESWKTTEDVINTVCELVGIREYYVNLSQQKKLSIKLK